MALRYFTFLDFNRCSPRCDIADMNPEFLAKLDEAREIAGVPFVLNSAFRSVEYELDRGRTGTGAHTLGCAVDIACQSSSWRIKIVSALVQVGFVRIGIAKTFIHVDSSTLHPPGIWLY